MNDLLKVLLSALGNRVVKAITLSSSALATYVEMTKGIDTWLGRMGLIATFFSATAVGAYHVWKIIDGIKNSARQRGRDQEPT